MAETVHGRTPAVIVSVAHLDDEERALVLGLLLEEVLTWVRRLSGTRRLRALIAFDVADLDKPREFGVAGRHLATQAGFPPSALRLDTPSSQLRQRPLHPTSRRLLVEVARQGHVDVVAAANGGVDCSGCCGPWQGASRGRSVRVSCRRSDGGEPASGPAPRRASARPQNESDAPEPCVSVGPEPSF